MSIRDEIAKAREEEIRETYSDEAVYHYLLKDWYEIHIKGSVLSHFQNNPDAKEFSSRASFIAQGKTISAEEYAKLKRDTLYYASGYDDYTHSYGVCLKFPWYTFERKRSVGANKIITLTPMGEIVLRDLKQIAAADEIVIGDPVGKYFCEYTSFAGHTKTSWINVPVGRRFSGKDPNHIRHQSGASVYLPYSFRL